MLLCEKRRNTHRTFAISAILLSQLKVANAARAKESTHAESIFVINESRKKTHYARKCEPGLGDGEKVRAVTKRNELPPFAPRLQYQKAYFTVPAQRAVLALHLRSLSCSLIAQNARDLRLCLSECAPPKPESPLFLYARSLPDKKLLTPLAIFTCSPAAMQGAGKLIWRRGSRTRF